MKFIEVVNECASNKEFVENWARLYKIYLPKNSIELMIDNSSGHSSAIAKQFLDFVFEYVCLRCPREVIK